MLNTSSCVSPELNSTVILRSYCPGLSVPGSTNFGVEASIRPISFRAGSLDGRLTAGIGTLWEGLSFDYAYSDEDYGRLHTLSLSFSFGDPIRDFVSTADESEEQVAAR